MVLGRLLGMKRVLLASWLFQSKNHQAFVVQRTRAALAQVVMKLGIVFQPPERGPRHGEIGRAPGPQPFQFLNSVPGVGWRPPIMTLLLQKRDDPISSQLPHLAPLRVIHQNESRPGGNQLSKLQGRQAKPSRPVIPTLAGPRRAALLLKL